VGVGAFSSELAFALLVLAADLDSVLVELLHGLVLLLVALACDSANSWSSAATGASSAILISAGRFLVACDVLVLAVLTEAALATVLEVTADLLFARGVFGSGDAVGCSLVLRAVEESAPLTESALFLLGPVVAVALGGVVTRRCVDLESSGVFVLALVFEAAFSIVSESPADLLPVLSLCAGSQLLLFGVGCHGVVLEFA